MAAEAQLAYDPEQKIRSRHNRRVARQNGWRWDAEFETYRNEDNFAMNPDGEFPANPVDCLR